MSITRGSWKIFSRLSTVSILLLGGLLHSALFFVLFGSSTDCVVQNLYITGIYALLVIFSRSFPLGFEDISVET